MILPIFLGFIGLYFLPNLIDWKMRGAYSHSDDRFSAGARVLSGPKPRQQRFWQEAPLILGGTVQRPTSYSMSARKELERLQEKRKQAREFRVRAAKRRLALVITWALVAMTLGIFALLSNLHWAWISAPLTLEALTLTLGVLAAKRGREKDTILGAKITRLQAQILPVETALSATAQSLQQQEEPAHELDTAAPKARVGEVGSASPEAISVLDRLIATYQKAKGNAVAAFAAQPVENLAETSSSEDLLGEESAENPMVSEQAGDKLGSELDKANSATSGDTSVVKKAKSQDSKAGKAQDKASVATAQLDNRAVDGEVEISSSTKSLQASQTAIAPVSATLTTEATPSGAIPMPIPVYKRKKAVLGLARELSDSQGKVQKVTLPYRPDQVRSTTEPSLSTGELAALDTLEKVIENRRVTSA